jgi:hypothetical protein
MILELVVVMGVDVLPGESVRRSGPGAGGTKGAGKATGMPIAGEFRSDASIGGGLRRSERREGASGGRFGLPFWHGGAGTVLGP